MPSHVVHPRLAKENTMNKPALLAALLGTAFLATAAQAQTQAPAPAAVRTEGGYFGVGVMSVTSEAAKTIAAAFAGASAESNTTGYKLYGGYMWGNWGVELGYYDMGKAEVKIAGATSDTLESKAATLAAVYSAPFAGKGMVHLKAGAAHVSSEYNCVSLCGGNLVNSEKTSTPLFVGIGLGWRLSQGIQLRLDFERMSDVVYVVGTAGEFEGPIEIMSLSAQFNF